MSSTAPWAVVLALLNDSETDDDSREGWVKNSFKMVLDYEVEFVGKYPPGGRKYKKF